MFFNLKKHKKVHIAPDYLDILRENLRLLKDMKKLSRQRPKQRVINEDDYIRLMAEINNVIANSLLNFRQRSNKANYVISSLFLQDSFCLLNKSDVESMHFVTGPEVDDKKILDKIIDFRLEQQSIVYAKAESESVRKALIYLSLHKFKLLGYFHIHPGSGPGSTIPSSTDLALDSLLNKGGYEPVGAIFSRDGFIRFFSLNKFNIQVYGKGVEKINEKLYRFVEIS